MKVAIRLGLFFLFVCVCGFSSAQTGKELPPDDIPDEPPPLSSDVPPDEMNPLFGRYYNIADYHIRVPFNEPPYVSPGGENDKFKVKGYRYAYPSPKDDINILYGIDVCEFKSDSIFKTTKSKIDYYATLQKKTNMTGLQGTLISETSGGSGDGYFRRDKMKVVSKDIGEVYVTSLYFCYKGNAVRLYVFAPNNIDNKRIEDFFASVKFD